MGATSLATLAPRTGGEPRVWAEPVRGDRMSPTLEHMQDYVLCRASDHYEGEGVYLLRDDLGTPVLFRASSAFNAKKEVRLFGDNMYYGDRFVPKSWFDQHVIGIVIADIKTRITREMRRLTAT